MKKIFVLLSLLLVPLVLTGCTEELENLEKDLEDVQYIS